MAWQMYRYQVVHHSHVGNGPVGASIYVSGEERFSFFFLCVYVRKCLKLCFGKSHNCKAIYFKYNGSMPGHEMYYLRD